MIKPNSIILLLAAVLMSSVIGDSILYTSVPDNSSLCGDFFLNLTNPNYTGPNMSVEINNMFIYSGHNLNDLGWYSACQEISTQAFTMITIQGYGIGFCGPSFCSVDQLQEYTGTILQVVSNLTQQNLTSSPVTFTDPNQTGIIQGFWFYFTVALFSILIGLVIAGTAMVWYQKRKARLENAYASEDSLSEGDNSSVINNGILQNLLVSRPIEEPELSLPDPLFIRILQCFDIVENFEALFQDEKIPGHDQNLNVTAGLRTLAFCWVVYGHTFLQAETAKDYMFEAIFEQSAWYLLVIAALYAVDTFFYLSGFFTGFLMINKLKKMPLGFKNYALVLFHRWIRLWPAYFVTILFYWKISVYLGDGPFWPSNVSGIYSCQNSSWKNFLLLDTVLANFEDYCFSWGWYVACDFQLFLMAPFICWIYIKNRKRSQIILAILMGVSLCAGYAYALDTGYTFIANPGSSIGLAFMADYYVNPLVRMSPYIIGIWLGFMFKEYKDGKTNIFTTLEDSYPKSLICSLSGFVLLLMIVFVPRMLQTGTVWSDGFATTWSTLSRPIWAIGIFMLTAPCLVGNLEDLSLFLGNFYFVLIARLSYTAYLVHFVFLLIIYEGLDQYYGSSQGYQACLALALIFFACFGATIIHLFVEKPITNIEANILSGKKNSSTVLRKRNANNITVLESNKKSENMVL